ncbi:helix-turn-helix domain-containing protein (plasmid) [Streptomyces sp. LZ34]
MSIEHMAMVFAAGGIEAKERLLLLAYTNRCDAHGYCWPGEDRLVEETGMSASTVRRAKKNLINMGLIKSLRRPDTSNLTRVNIALLASMKRPKRDYDDNLVERIAFTDPAATPSKGAPTYSGTTSDLRTVHSDLDHRSSCSGGQVRLTCGPGQPDLETVREPAVELSEEPDAPSARSANEARRASTGSRGAATRGSAASGKSRHRLTKAEYEAIKSVRALLPDDLEAKLPVKTPTNLGAAILAALAAGSPYERTPAQLVEYRVLKRWNGFWARKFYAGELTKGPAGKPSVVGPLLAMLKHQQECGDISCEDRVNIHTGEQCRACETRREDRKADRRQEADGGADDFPQQRPELPLRECHDCGRPIRSAVPALCRDCCEDAKA